MKRVLKVVIFVLPLLFFLFFPFKNVYAQSEPLMVKDINTTDYGGDPRYFVIINDIMYFTSTNLENGKELWSSDGTEIGTVMLKDINTGSYSSNPYYLTAVDTVLYFIADDGVHGYELWKSDGTEVGTVLVKDIYAGSQGSGISNPTAIGTTLYFRAQSETNGSELWKSDGTEVGTVLVKDIYVGSAHSFPSNLTAIGTTLYFSATNNTYGWELWKSDGTSAGTVLVKDIYGGSYYGSDPSNLTVIGTTLYFRATDGTNGRELWKSDGTSGGTVLVKNINGGGNHSSPSNLTVIGTTLYFSATDNTYGTELWKSDGTSIGTVLVKDIYGSYSSGDPSYLTVIGTTLYFRANNGTNGYELWTSDGTADGTVMVKDINSEGSSSYPYNLTSMGTTLYFSCDNGTNGYELWKSDGTADGTVMVKDIHSGVGYSNPDYLTTWNETLYFASNDGINGIELWKSDGSNLGTTLFKDFITEPVNSSLENLSEGGQILVIGNNLFFSADDGINGVELWKSNGTEVGTELIKDIYSGSYGSYPYSFASMGTTLYFTANNGINGSELWKSDGTEAGTVMVKEIYEGEGGFNDEESSIVAIGDTLYFNADNGVDGEELWKSDGTEAGTVMVKDIYFGENSSYPNNLTAIGNTLYFSARTSGNGRELWKSDGTANGTVMVKDVSNGEGGIYLYSFTPIGSTLYFIATDEINEEGLWKSDGTTEGTIKLRDVYFDDEINLVAIGDTIYFNSYNEVNGEELWKSDGTTDGTVMVKDIYSGENSSYPHSLTTLGDTLYFIANNGTNGYELWKSDGTANGTVMVIDINSGEEYGYPENLTAIGNYLFFSGYDETNGNELWRSNGTEEGTVLIKDISLGAESSYPSLFNLVNKTMFFTAQTRTSGRELWTLDLGEDIDLKPPTTSGYLPSSGSSFATNSLTVELSLDEEGDCRASTINQTYELMADDFNCSGDFTTSISCTLNNFGLNGIKDVYISCRDTYFNTNTTQTNTHLTYTFQDSQPPTKSYFSPVSGTNIVTQTPTITLRTDENASCRLSLTDEAYDSMSDNVICSGGGSIYHSCVSTDLGDLLVEKDIYISCMDANGNKDTVSSNSRLTYTLITSNISNSQEEFPKVLGTIYATALSEDGSILYVGGNFTEIGDIGGTGGVERDNLAAINTSDFSITSWAPVTDGTVYTIEVNGDSIYVGGSFNHIGETSTGEFAKINSEGILDTSCLPNIHTFQATETVYDISITDKYIYVGGSFNYIGGTQVTGLVRLSNSNSCTWDNSWVPTINRYYWRPTVYTIDTYGDDIYIGGDFYGVNGTNTGEFAKINSDGSLDSECIPNIYSFEEISSTVYSIQAVDDYIYIGGSFDYVGETDVSGLVRLRNNSSCTWDNSWQPNLDIDATVRAICPLDNDIFVGGSINQIGDQNTEFAKLSSATALTDTLWNPEITTEEMILDTVYSCTVGNSGIYVGGSFDYVGEEVRHGLASFEYDTQPPEGTVVINSGLIYTANPNVTLTLSSSDAQKGTKEMIVCGNSSFSGCNWEIYSTTKLWTFENTSGTKTIYVKYKDSVGNVSGVYTDTIILHTPSVLITEIGLVKNIPNKSPYTMYFTSQTPVVKGITQPSSTVFFVYGEKTYTSIADTNGNFTITLNVSRGNNTIQYYSKDISNNQSVTKTITLIVGIEYFPEYLLQKLGLITPTEEETIEEPKEEIPQENQQPNQEEEEKPDTDNGIQTIQFLDKDNNPLVNALVIIEGQEYYTDSKGEIKVLGLEQGKNYKVKVEYNGIKYETEVLGEKQTDGSVIVNITEGDISKGIDIKRIGIYGGISLLFILFLIIILKKGRKKKEEETYT